MSGNQEHGLEIEPRLADMAADPDIQREIMRINAEFVETEMDGLNPNDRLEPYWTLRRVIYLVIILITLIAFLLYTLAPLFFPLAPPPLPTIPHQQV